MVELVAEFFLGLGGRQAEAALLPLGIPGNNGDDAEDAVDPVDETQAPIGRIQADDARAKRKEVKLF